MEENVADQKVICQQCRKEFLIISQEQEFLAKLGLPSPSKCPTCRQIDRLKARGERRLYRTSCQKCNKNIIVTYDPTSVKSRILCKECYLDFFEKEKIVESAPEENQAT